jgi:hypothetical protein
MMLTNDEKALSTENARLKSQSRCTSGLWKKTNGRKTTGKEANHKAKDVAQDRKRKIVSKRKIWKIP